MVITKSNNRAVRLCSKRFKQDQEARPFKATNGAFSYEHWIFCRWLFYILTVIAIANRSYRLHTSSTGGVMDALW